MRPWQRQEARTSMHYNWHSNNYTSPHDDDNDNYSSNSAIVGQSKVFAAANAFIDLQAFLKDIGHDSGFLESLKCVVKSDSPLISALGGEKKDTAKTDAASPKMMHASSSSEMKSHLFQMQKLGFEEGSFCKLKRSQGEHEIYEITMMVEAGLEICKRVDGKRATEGIFIGAKTIITDWKPEKGAQEVVVVKPASLAFSSKGWLLEASKSAAFLALRKHTMKYSKANSQDLDVLKKPTEVSCKRKFEVGELIIQSLSLESDFPPCREQCTHEGSSPYVHTCL